MGININDWRWLKRFNFILIIINSILIVILRTQNSEIKLPKTVNVCGDIGGGVYKHNGVSGGSNKIQ